MFAPWARPPKVPPLPPVSVTRRARKRAALTPFSPLQIRIGRRGPLVSVPRSIAAPAGGQGGHLATADIRRRPRPLRRMAWAPMAPGAVLERSPPCAVWRLSAATPGLSCPCVPAVGARGAAHSAVATRAASRRASAGVPHPAPELRRHPSLGYILGYAYSSIFRASTGSNSRQCLAFKAFAFNWFGHQTGTAVPLPLTEGQRRRR